MNARSGQGRCRCGRVIFKNAALLTGSDVCCGWLACGGLRIWLANALGGAGMGLYQLVLAVCGLFVTLATAGISVAAARLLTEELSRDKAAARGMLVRLVLAGLTLGGLAMAAQLATAGRGKMWLGMSVPLPRCAPRRWDCHGWLSRQCCAAFFWHGGGWNPTCSASWQSRRCALPRWWALSRTQGWPDGQPLCTGAGCYRPERGHIHRPDGIVLPAGRRHAASAQRRARQGVSRRCGTSCGR